MNSDLRLIRLCRKTNGEGIQKNNYSQQYLSTDYFDVLHCVKKDIWDDFNSIMGIGENGEQNLGEIAIQSYTLFCDGETVNKYENSKCYGDPFDDLAGKDTPFLSIIQVHITPEIIARLESEHSKNAQGFLTDIEQDIHEILDDFLKGYLYPVCYKIYRLLSTGDFAVVIRSKMPEVSYELAMALRRRYVCTNDNVNSKKIVLYKTYTLLTIAHNVISTKENEENTTHSKGNRFVIRCCFSNKYWSEKEKVDNFWKSRDGFSDIQLYYLSGRYDFTIYLTEEEFRNVFPHIALYKNIDIGNNKYDSVDMEEADQADAVKYLVYLMEHGYLSYINERYLLDEIKIQDESKDESSFPKVKNQEYVAQRNIKKYEYVQKLYEAEVNRIFEMRTNRKKLILYMELLHKLIYLCQTINNLSDTRISVAVLLEQIETLFDSLKSYLDYIDYKEEDGFVILRLIEDYLRESVDALDAFSRYIRNNNLQTLQAPNYNIESNTSMEKILIAFSEYAFAIIEDYINCNVECLERKDLPTKKYIPVVVPNLGKRQVSVEVMFPEWNIYRNQDFINHVQKYLLIVTCPTVKELGNVPFITASLLHEIAHQFRYESREVRNDSILKYVLLDFFELLSDRIIQEFEVLKSNYKLKKRIMCIFRKVLLEAFLEEWLMEACKWEKEIEDINLINAGKKASFAYYEECIWNNMNCFLESWEDTVNLLVHVNQFIRDILQYVSIEDKETKEQLKSIEDALNKIQNKEISFEDWKEEIGRIKNSSIKLYIKGGEGIIKDASHWRKMWNKAIEDPQILWDTLVNEDYFDKYSEKERAKLLEIRDALLGLCQWHSQLGRAEYEQTVRIRIRKNYVKTVYLKVCKEWKDYSDDIKRSSSESMAYQQLINEAGRYFGIDYFQENNENRFSDILKNGISKAGNNALDKIREDISEYREETADMFMCGRMSLDTLGYVSLIAREVIVDKEVSLCNLWRIIRVVAVMWCKIDSKDFNEFFRSYQEQCTDLFFKIIKYVNVILTYNNLNEWGDSVHGWEKDQSYDSVCNFSEQIMKCYHYISSKIQEKSELEKEFIHPATMLKILYNMVYYGGETLLKLFGDVNADDANVYILKEDYIKGRDYLRQFKKIKRSSDMKVLDKRLEQIVRIVNEPWQEYQQESKAEVNKEIIGFVTDMYYRNKRRNARGKGDENRGK